MMLLLTVFYSIPELDISAFFLTSCSAGRGKLTGAANMVRLGQNASSEVLAGNSNNASSADPERIRLNNAASAGPKYSTASTTQHLSTGVSYLDDQNVLPVSL